MKYTGHRYIVHDFVPTIFHHICGSKQNVLYKKIFNVRVNIDSILGLVSYIIWLKGGGTTFYIINNEFYIVTHNLTHDTTV